MAPTPLADIPSSPVPPSASASDSDWSALRLALIDFAAENSLAQLLAMVVERVGRLMASPAGYLHFIAPDQGSVVLKCWSAPTPAKEDGRAAVHSCPVERVAIWAESVDGRRAVVDNDGRQGADLNGLQPGGAYLCRQMVVPVLRQGRVAALFGIAGKAVPYDGRDVDMLTSLADIAWEVIRGRMAEDNWRLQNEIESACAEVSSFLLGSRDLLEISLRVLDTARMLTRSAHGFVGSIDRDSGHLVSHSLTRDVLESCRLSDSTPVFHEFTGLWGWVLKHRRALRSNDASADPRAGSIPAGHVPIRAFLGVPAMSGGEVVGIVALANPRHSFEEIDQTIAQRLADLYALAIERHNLEADLIAAQARRAEELEELVRERTAELHQANERLLAENRQRRQTEVALAAEKDMARRYLENARVGFVALDRRGVITMVNPCLRQVLGFREEELLGRLWRDFTVSGDDLSPAMRELAEADEPLRDRRQRIFLRAADGSTRILSCSLTPLEGGSGASATTLVSAEDITMRLVAERQLRASRIRLEILAAILENTPLAMVFYVVERDGVKILDWNNSAEKMFGWSKAEVLGRDFMSFLPIDDDVDLVRTTYAMLKANPGAHNLANWCNCKSGDERLVHWFNNSFVDEKTEHIYVVSLGHDITRQHLFEQQLRDSEQKLRTIADFTFDWEDWRGPDGRYLYISPSCQRTTGYSREDFLADSGLALAIVHPEDREAMARHFHCEWRDHEIYSRDFRIVTRGGETRWISHCCQPVFDENGRWLGRRSSNRDITDRKTAEQLVTDSRNMLQMVFDGIQEPLVLMRPDGHILMMNRTARRYFRVDGEGSRAGRCWELIGGSSSCAGEDGSQGCGDCRVLRALHSGEGCDFERRGLHDPTRSEHVFVDIVNNGQGAVEAAILRIYDTTLMRQMEKDLLQADKMISLGTLVSGVAHEINNPNNFISLNINLLKDAWASFRSVLDRHCEEHGDFITAGLPYSEMREEVPNLLIGIEAGSRRIQRIVQELKDYSVPSLDRLDREININTVVQQAVTLIDSKIAQYTDNFHLAYTPGLPPVRGSAQKLEQVVINLLINACQALAGCGALVRVATAWDESSDTVRVVVEDEGVGIEAARLQHIMDPFFTTKRDMGGTGLGLSVSARIVAEHHGRIEVHSRPGKGSTFTLCLPAARGDAQHQQ